MPRISPRRLFPALLAAVLASAACSDGTGGDDDDTPPQLTIASPADGSVTTAASVTVSGTASDDRRVTGMRYHTAPGPGTAIDIDPGTVVPFSFTLPLAMGDNAFAVSARDASGNESIHTRVVRRQAAPR
jgi:hypothetical protein